MMSYCELSVQTTKKDDNGNDNPNYTEQVLFTKTYPAAEKADAVEVSASIANAEKFPNIGFEIASSSNVNWEQIRWIPSVTYKDSSSVDQTLAIPAHYRMFTHAVKESHSYTFAATDTAVIVKPRITVAKGFNGDVTLTVKTADKLLAKKTFTITEGTLKADVLKLENPGTERSGSSIIIPVPCRRMPLPLHVCCCRPIRLVCRRTA